MAPVNTKLSPPLSWREARSVLRNALENYTKQGRRRQQQEKLDVNNTVTSSLWGWWLKLDLDIYIGTFGASLALLFIASFGFLQEETDSFVRKSQLVAAVLMLSGSIFNILVVRRRRFSISKGSDKLKRREISKFLKELEKQEDECMHNTFDDASEDSLTLSGTSLTDIYPVYRRCNNNLDGTPTGGSWSRIPSLLLVQGDHIALQVGDTAPANCRIVSNGVKLTEKIIGAGDRITLETSGENANSILNKLPKGRTTLKNNSEDLLTLCNKMRLFVLVSSPIETFLRQRKVKSKKPQSSRQLETIRARLSIVGISVFVITAAVSYARLNQEFMDLYLTLPVPFLAAISIFPFTGPICLIFIEALGTARILASYHPVSILQKEGFPNTLMETDMLVFRYFLVTTSNRLSLQDLSRKIHHIFSYLCPFFKSDGAFLSGLVRVPPASSNLLEKLGVATAFTLVDDELVCEPDAIPQQLLIPSGKGLKLLDLCPTYEDESDGEANDSSSEFKRDGDFHDSDTDSDDGLENHHPYNQSLRKRRRFRIRKSRMEKRERKTDGGNSSDSDDSDHEVQFEDPLWWQHLPSLKCIGLACLLVDQCEETTSEAPNNDATSTIKYGSSNSRQDLVRLICAEQRSMQLRSLAQCIGFSIRESDTGEKGDITPFQEKVRLHVVSTARLRERLEIDSHERGSEESRWWGSLRPDSTSIIVQDSRSGSYQLLTVGDPRVVTRMCQQAWQGENATILPLAAHERANILETSNGWKLGDLASTAFSYTPIPPSFGLRCQNPNMESQKFYLLDNDPKDVNVLPAQKDKMAIGTEWPLLFNQIFLGVLGSPVIPRQETAGLLKTLQDAGVRFVYFSPRNMRLTKEIASQMGIDVAWNCAISLRALDQGEEDPHRMVSTYADWDVNAKLPHGIESVRRHLEEVDNVPLLVSLFTDVTKKTTMQLETFQDYNDNVIAVGLSHLPWNSRIFSTADLSVGVDVLADCFQKRTVSNLSQGHYNSLLPSEISFVSAISGHLCAFRLRGVSSIAYMPTILAHGRASFEAATSATLFLMFGYLSFGFYVFFCTCSISKALPTIPIFCGVLYLQIVLPLVGLPITMSDPDSNSMHRVPPKNDPNITFGKREGKLLSWYAVLKALPPAILPQLLYLICLGEFMISFDSPALKICSSDLEQGDWIFVIRCNILHMSPWYEAEEITGLGEARQYASTIAFAEFMICTIVASAAYVHRTLPLHEEPPWQRNHFWVFSSLSGIAIALYYIYTNLGEGTLSMLPWYTFALFGVMPFLCLAFVEVLKRKERLMLDRAEKLRRLQFETRLGMWSPK